MIGFFTERPNFIGTTRPRSAIVNPRQVKAFGQALGQRAKSDPIDAALIARFGETIQPSAKPLPDEDQAALELLRAGLARNPNDPALATLLSDLESQKQTGRAPAAGQTAGFGTAVAVLAVLRLMQARGLLDIVERGALLVRMASSHVRFGSLEAFYYRQQYVRLRQLADYVIDHDFPDLRDRTQPYLTLLREVVGRTARLIAQWQLVGFIHGVMNTDNMSVLGLTIDYGPYANTGGNCQRRQQYRHRSRNTE